MIAPADPMKKQPDVYHPFLSRLKQLFADMDRAYHDTAARYGFHCTGCEDNCCRTRFYHHTLLEYLLLMEGFFSLDTAMQSDILQKARAVAEADIKGAPVRLMCPLNVNSLCILYNQRPMICRLHGLPHELHRPGRAVAYGPGCGTFDSRFGDKPYVRFDRTPYYIRMAALEKELQQALDAPHKIKMTVAQMLLAQQGVRRTKH